MHLFDYPIYYLSSQTVKQSDLCPCWSVWSSSVRLSQVTVISECSLQAAERSMHQCTAWGVRMQSNPQQSKGPNQQYPVDGLSATKPRNTWLKATNKVIHSSCFPNKQRKTTPLIFVTQSGVRRREWNWRQSNDSWLSIRHSKSSSVGGPVGIQHWVKSRSEGLYTIFPPVTIAECHI